MPTAIDHRFSSFFLAIVLTACAGTGTDTSTTTTGTATGAGTGTGTATGTSTGSATGTGTGTATGTSTGTATGTGTGTGTGTATGTATGSGTGTGTGTGTLPLCPSAPQLQEIADYLALLNDNAAFVRTHPSASEAVGMLLLPDYIAGPPSFMFLFMPCAGPSLFAEWCDGSTCWQTECVNPGASWIQHARLDSPPVAYSGWTYNQGQMDLEWTDPSPDFGITVTADAVDSLGDDYTLDGKLDMIGAIATTEIDFPNLLSGGTLVSTWSEIDLGANTVTGEALVGGVPIATLQDTGFGLEFIGNGACP